MRLRKPCEHGWYDEHDYYGPNSLIRNKRCPGGEFLPEGALVWWCEEHDERAATTKACDEAFEGEVLGRDITPCRMVEMLLVSRALASQVGESE